MSWAMGVAAGWAPPLPATVGTAGATPIAVASPELAIVIVNAMVCPTLACAGEALAVAERLAADCTSRLPAGSGEIATGSPVTASAPVPESTTLDAPGVVACSAQANETVAPGAMSALLGAELIASWPGPVCARAGSTPWAVEPPALCTARVAWTACPTLTCEGAMEATAPSCAGAASEVIHAACSVPPMPVGPRTVSAYVPSASPARPGADSACGPSPATRTGTPSSDAVKPLSTTNPGPAPSVSAPTRKKSPKMRASLAAALGPPCGSIERGAGANCGASLALQPPQRKRSAAPAIVVLEELKAAPEEQGEPAHRPLQQGEIRVAVPGPARLDQRHEAAEAVLESGGEEDPRRGGAEGEAGLAVELLRGAEEGQRGCDREEGLGAIPDLRPVRKARGEGEVAGVGGGGQGQAARDEIVCVCGKEVARLEDGREGQPERLEAPAQLERGERRADAAEVGEPAHLGRQGGARGAREQRDADGALGGGCPDPDQGVAALAGERRSVAGGVRSGSVGLRRADRSRFGARGELRVGDRVAEAVLDPHGQQVCDAVGVDGRRPEVDVRFRRRRRDEGHGERRGGRAVRAPRLDLQRRKAPERVGNADARPRLAGRQRGHLRGAQVGDQAQLVPRRVSGGIAQLRAHRQLDGFAGDENLAVGT